MSSTEQTSIPAATATPEEKLTYRIERIGQGTYGTVFLQIRNSDDMPQQVNKYMYPGRGLGPEFIPTFKKEVALFRAIYDSQYGSETATFHDFSSSQRLSTHMPTIQPLAAISMIYLGRRNLHSFIPKPTTDGTALPFPLPVPHFLSYLGQLMIELNRIHDLGILLLDIKPQNIVVSDDEQRASFIDFGNSLYERDAQEHLRTKQTTLSSKPPLTGIFKEQEHSKATDIFGLGMSFLELLNFPLNSHLKKLYGKDIYQPAGAPGAPKRKKNKEYLKLNPKTGETTAVSTIRNTIRFEYGKSCFSPRLTAKPKLFYKLMTEIESDFSEFLSITIPNYLNTAGIKNPELLDAISQDLLETLLAALRVFSADRLDPSSLKSLGEYWIDVAQNIACGIQEIEKYPDFPMHLIAPTAQEGGGGMGAAATALFGAPTDSDFEADVDDSDADADADADADCVVSVHSSDSSDSSHDFSRKMTQALLQNALAMIKAKTPSPEAERQEAVFRMIDRALTTSPDSPHSPDSDGSTKGIIVDYAARTLSERESTSVRMDTLTSPRGMAGAGSAVRAESTTSVSSATVFAARACAVASLNTHMATPTAQRPHSDTVREHASVPRPFFEAERFPHAHAHAHGRSHSSEGARRKKPESLVPG